MKVKELIEELKRFPQDWEVMFDDFEAGPSHIDRAEEYTERRINVEGERQNVKIVLLS